MRLIVLAALLILTGTAHASDYTYNAADGYYYSAGLPYTRTEVYNPGYSYYSYGKCYYQAPYYSYSYSRYYPPAAPAKAAAPYDSFGVLAEAVAARDKVRGEIVKNQQFLEAARTLGFDGPLPLKGYGVPSYGYGGSALYGTFGYNTSSVYGYQQQSLAQAVNPFEPNLDQYFLQAFQLAEGAQAASRVASSEFQGSVNLAADKAAAIAAIHARKDAIVAFSRMLDGPPVATTGSYKFQIGPGGKISAEPSGAEVLPAPKGQAGTLAERWNASANTRCAACHYGEKGEKKEGGFSVADYPTMTPDKQAKVISLLVLPKDHPKFMPKGGEPLPETELAAWIAMMTAERPPAAPKLPKKK